MARRAFEIGRQIRLYGGVSVLAVTVAACAGNPKPDVVKAGRTPDTRTVAHLLNRTTFGARADDVAHVQRIGIAAYVDEQLHPEQLTDVELAPRLASLRALDMAPKTFASGYYQPMNAARQKYTATQKLSNGGAALPSLGWHLLPIAAVSLPGGTKAVAVLQQSAVTPEELFFQRQNQRAFDELQDAKLLRAVYSERQLQEVLTDFWFNHFNVDARKIEDRPVVAEYEREAIRPLVFGRFRDLLEATAKSPAMLFYLDNWLSTAPPAPVPPPRARFGALPPKPAPAGRGLNENYGRELMELHTLGVDGGYTQHDVIEVARAFTGWTMKNAHDGSGFFFNDKVHDHGPKRVLGHTLKPGHGVEDGERVLDLLAQHPSTAHFIATKLVRHFVADTPPPALVDRVAHVFRKTDGNLREVMRTILLSPEFYAESAYRAKMKSPFEYVASALRATNASITNPRPFVGIIASMGEPLYQCQPPTGYGDRADVWMNTGTLIARVNFARTFATNGANASKVDVMDPQAVPRLTSSVLADDLSDGSRAGLAVAGAPAAARVALLLGSPEFQRR